jgi:hypothetical protein
MEELKPLHPSCSGPCCLPPETAAWKYGQKISENVKCVTTTPLQSGDPQGSIGSGSINSGPIQCPPNGSWHVLGCSCLNKPAPLVTQGWIYPACGSGVSPYATRCPCKPLPALPYGAI